MFNAGLSADASFVMHQRCAKLTEILKAYEVIEY